MSEIFIDEKVGYAIRSVKQGDKLFYTYGLENFICGVASVETFNETLFKKISPIGVEINGIFGVYNEETFQDFEEVLKGEIEKAKEKFSLKGKMCALAVKELLYLDDFETMEFEYKSYDENEAEVTFVPNILEKIKEKFVLIKARAEAVFQDAPTITEETKNNLFANVVDENQKMMIDNINNLSEENVEHILSFLNKMDLSSMKEDLKCVNINFNMKPDSSLKQIKINDEKFTLPRGCIPIESLGFVSKEAKNLKEILLEQFSKISAHALALKDELQNNTLSSSVVYYKNIYTPIPYLITIKNTINKEGENITFTKSEITDLQTLKTEYSLNSLIWFNSSLNGFTEIYKPSHLVSPHLIIDRPLPNEYVVRATVKGDYEYFHYNHEGVSDAGWGCAYRSLQSVFSWFLLNTNIGKQRTVPTIEEIQKTLVRIGDKDKKLIGSTDWIGAVEVNLVLNELLGIDSQIMHVSSGHEVSSKGRDLVYHFNHVGCPVMIGGGKFAYTILGVEYDRVKGECMFLILDPHYGGSDDPKTVTNKGWCAWKPVTLFSKDDFYNLCLPVIA